MNIADLDARLSRLETIFHGAISNYEYQKAQAEKQERRDKEAGAPGPNYAKNRERLAQEAERAKSYPKRQS